MRSTKTSYFTKMMGLNILLVTLPVIILGLAAYYTASHAIQEKVATGNMQALYQTQMRVESMLKLVDHLALNVIKTPLINNVMKGPLSTDDYEIVDELNERMNYMQSFELGVQGWVIASMDNGWLLSDRYSFPSIYKLDNKSTFKRFLEDTRLSYWTYQENSLYNVPSLFVESAPLLNKKNILLVKKVPMFEQTPSGLVILGISDTEINNILNKTKDLGDVMILDEQFQVMSHTNVNNIGNQMGEFLLPSMESMREENGSFVADKDGEKVTLTYRKSNYTGWTYLSLVSIRDITKDSRLIGYYTLIICIIIFVFMSAFALQASRKMYSPIRLLLETVSANFTSSKRKKDEFQAIHERFYNLIHSQDMMSTQIEKQLNQLSEFYILKLFLGELTENEISHKVVSFGRAADWKQFCVLVLQIDSFDNTDYSEHDRDLLLFAINNIAGELIPPYARLEPLVLHTNQVSLIGAADISEEELGRKAYHYAEILQKTVYEYLKLKVSVGISSTFNKLVHAPNAYEEGREALNYRVRFEDEVILYYAEVSPHPSYKLVFPTRLESELLDAIKMGDKQQIDEKLEQLLRSIFKVPMSHQEYQIQLMRLLSELIKLVQDSSSSIAELVSNKKSLIDQLQEQNSIQEIANWFKHTIIWPLVTRIEEHRDSLYRNISNDILEMIHNEFGSDLKLELCAERLNYHPGYLSRVFRKETGYTFSDYLAKHRLHIAKKWLVETDMNGSDIAEKIGYQNARSFSRYFKKTEGITPGQYRDLHQA